MIFCNIFTKILILSNKDSIKVSIKQLRGMKENLESTDSSVERFILSLQKSLGMESNLSSAINNAVFKLSDYQNMTKVVCSSIDRMINKANLLVDSINNEAE